MPSVSHKYEPTLLCLYWRILIDPVQEWLPATLADQQRIARTLAVMGWEEHAEQIQAYMDRMQPAAKNVFASNLHRNKRKLAEASIIRLTYGGYDVEA